VAEWDDGGVQNAYGDTETFNAYWVREGSQEDFERGILDGVEVVSNKLQLVTDGESGNRQKPYKITNTDSEITWTATTPTDTTLAIEAQVQGTTAITDEAVGTGDGVETVFYA
jgi:secreted PhoX family phosphatase